MNLEERIRELEEENMRLRSEVNATSDSPFLKASVKRLRYEAILDRQTVVEAEFGHRINERHGTMYELKNQARRLAALIGLDADMVRIMVNEALQNIIEHGTGSLCTVTFEVRNDVPNPFLLSSFKHEISPGGQYTLRDINTNALKGDVTSEYFDFESSRGRGEFMMKQLTDERRIINGVEILPDGRRVPYFKRILINYQNPDGPKDKVSFQELKNEIDKLDFDDVVCCFHVDYVREKTESVTIAMNKSMRNQVADIMKQYAFRPIEDETYYRTVFETYVPPSELDKEELLRLFSRVRQVIYQEVDQFIR